jgi:hypothetical protein
MELPNPNDTNMIIFLIKDNNTIWPRESRELTQQINNKNRGLTSFSNCLTQVMSFGLIRGANGRQTGWLTLR